MIAKSGYRSMLLVAIGFLMTLGTAYAEKKVTVEPSKLPAVIKQAIEKAFPKGEILAIEQEVEGEDPGQYDVELRDGDKEYELEITPEGSIKESKEQVVQESEAEESESPAKGKVELTEEDKAWAIITCGKDCKFATTGKNPYFILQPGYQLTIESKSEKVIITVLDETKKIGKVATRIVEEREFEDGELIEVSRNFFAQCEKTGDVYYFGEEVDDYKDGKVVGHGGAWRADEKDSQAGVIMPGKPKVGMKHYQEIAPNAMDRAEIIADDVTLKTPAGEFKNCLKVKETNPLEPGDVCYKIYARGIGLIQDEDLVLTSYSKSKGGKAEKAGESKEDAGEVKVPVTELPAKVRAALEKEAAGGKIVDVGRMKKGDATVYEAEVIKAGKEIDVLVSEKGELLGTEVQSEGSMEKKGEEAEREEAEDEEGEEDEASEDEESEDEESEDEDSENEDEDSVDEESDDEDSDDEGSENEDAEEDEAGEHEGAEK